MSKDKTGWTWEDAKVAMEKIEKWLPLILAETNLFWDWHRNKPHIPYDAEDGKVWNTAESRMKASGLIVILGDRDRPEETINTQVWLRPPGKNQMLDGYPRQNWPNTISTVEEALRWSGIFNLYFLTILFDRINTLPRQYWMDKYTSIPITKWKGVARFTGGKIDRMVMAEQAWKGAYKNTGPENAHTYLIEAIYRAIKEQYAGKKGA